MEFNISDEKLEQLVEKEIARYVRERLACTEYIGNIHDNPELMKRPIFANKPRYNITNTSNSSKFDDMVDDLKKGKQPKLGASMEGLTKRE